VLETGTLMRIGTSRVIETDVRIIAATNRDPREAVRVGKLRDDLYHRLNVFPLQMAPLRERGEDIELIAEHFLQEMNEACGTHKKFAPDAISLMRQYPWPGNVRELKNYIHRVFIMASDEGLEGPTPDHGAPSLQFAAPVPSNGEAVPLHASNGGPAITVPLGTPLSVAARELILSTLEHCGGERKRTAEMLGICTKTLYNRLREYGIREEQQRPVMSASRPS
ncbi:MAG TPA: sigma 54-interacting transcriptional regulator, partial [Usitatibacter sp.]|nr:sigma 54-interacting transcriptional regulator [Usitatibacter sp.]